ncbi:MAG: DUF1364 domain-containing protein [Gammaproteobacteria bacterium]|nr:DUF1364 domain-containing protein [Gammaproteobacteria bacterium]
MTNLRNSARFMDCALGIHPHCNMNHETTVLAHINTERKGMGIKSPDYFAVFACSDCHDIIDKRRYVKDVSEIEIQQCIIRGLYRTWEYWIEKGYVSHI